MLKRLRVFNGRDLISILYFGLVVLGIAYFLGNGDISKFFSTIKTMLPVSESVDTIKQFISNIQAEGSLGATKNKEPYEQIVLEYFPRSLSVIATSFTLAISLGITKGIFDYRNRYTYLNFLGTGVTSILNSLPDFFMIIVLQWVILIHFNFIDFFGHDQWFNFILPGILVSLYPMMYFARITFAALASEDGEMYIQYARAKGLAERFVIQKHILKKCFRSILQHLGVVMTYVVSNLFIVEWLMEYKGAAWRMMVSIKRLDLKIPQSQPFVDFPEIGLIVEISFCFVVLLLITQIVSVIWQNKYVVEKRNIWTQITKVFFQYIFIWFFVLFIISYLKPGY
ncbi:ABC transporter permease subunit [Bacillus sp. REN16]|uniref:ABC transporter permease subunit n=1 Tax=Bacillus sp. REN16 TaxID=2887296 RepID=UPI001E47F4C3|nr:ABC transporter permease subunit [Bacillus sp. REN16]MCC3356295.1 ABC transporter permease subunit [Bacillus sp. REN16]